MIEAENGPTGVVPVSVNTWLVKSLPFYLSLRMICAGFIKV